MPQKERAKHLARVQLCLAGLLLFLASAAGAAPARAAALLPCAEAIAPGTTLACAIGAAGETDSVTLSGIDGAVYLLRVATTAGELRPLVQVLAPDNSPICQGSNPYGPGAEIARCTFTQSGAYTIRIGDTTGTRTGTYNLYAQQLTAPADATSLTIGATHIAAISTGAEASTFTLTGPANAAFLLRMGVTAGAMRPIVRVFGADGATICSASYNYGPGAEITRCVLPQAGTYTVLAADTSAAQTGSYNLYVQRLTTPAGATALEPGATRSATIQASAEADTYTITGPAGAAFLLRMGVTAGAMRPIVRVFGADGATICSASQPYGPGAEITRCVLPQAGTYTVLAADTSAAQTGSYNLYVQRLTTPASATDLGWGTTTPAILTLAAELDSYTVQAAANDVLLIRVAVTAGGMRPIVRVFDPDGVGLCGASQPYGPGAEITRCLIPRDGRFLVAVGDTTAALTGSYNLYLQRLTDPANPQVIRAATPLGGVIQLPAEADTFRWSAGSIDRLTVTVTATSGDLRPGVRVFDPAGTQVCAALSPYSAKAEIADCLLPQSGAYTILVGDVSATKTGAYQVAVSCLSSPCGAPSDAPLRVYLPLLRR